MQVLACACCNREYPTGDVFDVQGRILCKSCHDEFLEAHPHCAGEGKQIVDPTICARCGSDQGNVICEPMMGSPCCPACVDFLRHRPYPLWVKGFFSAVVLFVAFSVIWNWRFLQGHWDVKAAFAAAGAGDIQTAASRMSAAVIDVPESAELKAFAALFEGVSCLKNDECEKADACFAKCSHLPPSWGVAALRAHAASGAAFDRKDYHRFLEIAEQLVREQPRDPMALAQVASACACLYVVEDKKEWRDRAEAKLEEAKAIDSNAVAAARYEERICHRLQTREIIDRKEYLRRFPEAAKSAEEPKP
jgi:hypothetical protein